MAGEEEKTKRPHHVVDGYRERAERKQAIVDHLAEHDRITHALKQAKVPYHSYLRWKNEDPDFVEALKLARKRYRDRVVEIGQSRAFDGYIAKRRTTYTRDGQEIKEEEWKYDSPVLQMELKRVEPEYKDRQEVAITGGGGGVIIVPPVFKTAEEWLLFVKKMDEIFDAVAPAKS